jgi:cytidyltransferase-like protein
MMKELLRRLLVLQLKGNGITQKQYSQMSANEKKLLAKKGARHFLLPKYRKKLKVVLTGGVFDILHVGHLATLRAARKLGDILVVVVASDEWVAKIKGKKPINSAKVRAKRVGLLKEVDVALMGGKKREDMIRRVHPNIIAFGYDQKAFVKHDGFKIARLKAKVAGMKTSLIAKRTGAQNQAP